MRVKVSDHAMWCDRYAGDYYVSDTQARLPVRWMSWEALLLGRHTAKSDVWAFAVALWEILVRCDQRPHEELTDLQVSERISIFFISYSTTLFSIIPSSFRHSCSIPFSSKLYFSTFCSTLSFSIPTPSAPFYISSSLSSSSSNLSTSTSSPSTSFYSTSSSSALISPLFDFHFLLPLILITSLLVLFFLIHPLTFIYLLSFPRIYLIVFHILILPLTFF